tara:strand:+ start:242 stop:976 length:735 start_codon:yes stop_codon:yes gene_type:complete
MSAEPSNTPLSLWLDAKNMSANQLASLIGVSPNVIYPIVRGDYDRVSKTVITAISNQTGITIRALITGQQDASNKKSETGIECIDNMLNDIAEHLHQPTAEQALTKYIADDFRCSGPAYTDNDLPKQYVTFAEMNLSNNIKSGEVTRHVKVSLKEAHFQNLRAEPIEDCTLIYTINRAFIASNNGSSNANEIVDTIAIYELEKSVGQMAENELPKIRSWWWHTYFPDDIRLERMKNIKTNIRGE